LAHTLGPIVRRRRRHPSDVQAERHCLRTAGRRYCPDQFEVLEQDIAVISPCPRQNAPSDADSALANRHR
jgi:hypothetical protein